MKPNVSKTLKAALSHERSGNLDAAKAAYAEILKHFPGNKPAKAAYAKLTRKDTQTASPHPPPREVERLTATYNDGRYEEARNYAKALLRTYPGSFIVWYIFSASLENLKDHDAALEGFQKVIALNPDYPNAYNNIGIYHHKTGDDAKALEFYEKSLALNPKNIDALNNKGKALISLRKLKEARQTLKQARAIDPDDAKTAAALGSIYFESDNYPTAIKYFNEALEKGDEQAATLCSKFFAQRLICDWSEHALHQEMAPKLGVETEAISCFPLLALEDHPERQLLRSQNAARKHFEHIAAASLKASSPDGRRIKLGYISADFRNFPSLFLMVEMLARHDRDAFEVYAFAYGPPEEDDMTARVIKSVDHFIKIHDLSDEDAAALVREHGIDIAIHENGYTKHERTGIFARRAAPVQVNYLGYPGSLGAEFIDYIIADPILIPEEHRKDYAEKIIYLPDTYQANDETRVIADTSSNRADFNLPEDAFVFCCFNNSYKLSAAEFDIWMRLLGKVDNSVLWLLGSNTRLRANLFREATARGVDPKRLVFANRVPLAEHLARHRCADLFLDTFNYNAHTTASDALWAGLPLVTKMGAQFSARVSASLLSAVGLPELITTSDEDYEALILKLATDPSHLAEIKAKLLKNRMSFPLFDTDLYTRNFERGMEEALRICSRGEAPRDIVVSEL